MWACVAFAGLLLRMQCELVLVAPEDDTRIKFERLATECSVTIFRRIGRPDGDHAGRAFVVSLSLSLSLHGFRSLRRLPFVCEDAQGLMKKLVGISPNSVLRMLQLQ